ncbi:hypothetical protein LXL04_037799 [Taraxacum kok-saghyz]
MDFIGRFRFITAHRDRDMASPLSSAAVVSGGSAVVSGGGRPIPPSSELKPHTPRTSKPVHTIGSETETGTGAGKVIPMRQKENTGRQPAALAAKAVAGQKLTGRAVAGVAEPVRGSPAASEVAAPARGLSLFLRSRRVRPGGLPLSRRLISPWFAVVFDRVWLPVKLSSVAKKKRKEGLSDSIMKNAEKFIPLKSKSRRVNEGFRAENTVVVEVDFHESFFALCHGRRLRWIQRGGFVWGETLESQEKGTDIDFERKPVIPRAHPAPTVPPPLYEIVQETFTEAVEDVYFEDMLCNITVQKRSPQSTSQGRRPTLTADCQRSSRRRRLWTAEVTLADRGVSSSCRQKTSLVFSRTWAEHVDRRAKGEGTQGNNRTEDAKDRAKFRDIPEIVIHFAEKTRFRRGCHLRNQLKGPKWQFRKYWHSFRRKNSISQRKTNFAEASLRNSP